MSKVIGANVLFFLTFVSMAPGQSLGSAGTIEGTVTGPSGAVVSKATVEIRNPISGYQQSTTTDTAG
jgi:hypothetical protein